MTGRKQFFFEKKNQKTFPNKSDPNGRSFFVSFFSKKEGLAIACLLLALPAAATAQTSPFASFTPLPASVPAGSLPETAPFLLSNPAWTQRSIADRTTQTTAGQFNSGTWDMIDTNRTGVDVGRYLFAPFETSQPGIQRTDRWTGTTVTLWNAVVPNQVLSLDGSRWTPFGTWITAEENWGVQPQRHGRLFELTNPVTAGPGGGVLVHRNAVARVSHEGLAFDADANLYYIDETSGGSIYRYSSATPGNGATFFDGGTNAVLRVGTGFTANATGAATWVPFTDAAGLALPGAVTVTDPNGITSVDGRASTNVAAYKGTDYQRPEDLEIQDLGGGRQRLYVTATTTNEVYSIDLTINEVKRFVDRTTIDEATGLPVGGALTSPDNLAIDAAGNIYIVEDQPGGLADIWIARDDDRDGVAESVARWASMATVGAEPSGLYFDITNPGIAFIHVQHPSSGVDRLIEINAVPEPAGMMAVALGMLALLRRKIAP